MAPLSAAMAGSDSWQAWERALHRRCPAHRVEWVADGGYDELLAAFSQTLSVRTNAKIDKITDYAHRCAKETMGFSCEMSVYLDAFRRLGLLDRFTDFGCRHVKCEEVALCSRSPRSQ